MKHGKIVLLITILAVLALVMTRAITTAENPEDIPSPKTCTSKWLQDNMTLEETFNCIEERIEKTNSSQ